MARLFALTCRIKEIADYFGIDDAPDVAVPTETVEGTQGESSGAKVGHGNGAIISP
jgi:hypothetical protein